MTNINKVIVIGRLTKDLNVFESREFGYSANGTARALISIAVNRSVKKNNEWADEVSYFDVMIWGKTAENLKNYLQRGRQIAIEGFLKQDKWEKDGKKNSRIVIQAESVQLLGAGKSENNNNQSQPQSNWQNQNSYQNQSSQNDSQNSSEFQDDIPF